MRVSVSQQRLFLERGGWILKAYPVSTSKFGVGNRQGSERTPLGRHEVAEKIGGQADNLAIFRDRRDTGQRAQVNLKSAASDSDFITTRILWLRGLEPGHNQGGDVDSYDRMIYIHGTADEGLIGTPASHGCIRMKNADVMDLFGRVETGTSVIIEP